ncbi:MAG TPA: hypothetical protein DCZ43_11450, partial [candidate division Zixibacteria bacterium]|nr:hypothetical protein [candidate division Zixibacteria bacterium]
EAPSLISQVYLQGGGSALDISGNYAYMASGTCGLAVINISNPTSPVFHSIFDTPGTAYGVL